MDGDIGCRRSADNNQNIQACLTARLCSHKQGGTDSRVCDRGLLENAGKLQGFSVAMLWYWGYPVVQNGQALHLPALLGDVHPNAKGLGCIPFQHRQDVAVWAVVVPSRLGSVRVWSESWIRAQGPCAKPLTWLAVSLQYCLVADCSRDTCVVDVRFEQCHPFRGVCLRAALVSSSIAVLECRAQPPKTRLRSVSVEPLLLVVL